MSYSLSLRPRALAEIASTRENYAVIGLLLRETMRGKVRTRLAAYILRRVLEVVLGVMECCSSGGCWRIMEGSCVMSRRAGRCSGSP
jgi:hypothetical protein